jgi:GT2 family glycosyltransferase
MMQGMSPVVSVAMCVYNGQRHVAEAVESILGQTFTDFEFIIINDGSTDGTADILAGYDDPRLRVITQVNQGLTLSLNRALELCRGHYVARMDADDVSLPRRLEHQVAWLENHPRLGALGTAVWVIDDWGKVVPEEGQLETITGVEAVARHLIEGHNALIHGSVTMRREAVERVGSYREEFEYSQDYDLWLRIMEHYEVDNLPQVLYHWRASVGSTTALAVLRHEHYHALALECAHCRRAGKPEPPLARLPTSSREQAIGHVNNAKLHLRLGEFDAARTEVRRALANDWRCGPAWGLFLMMLPGNRFAWRGRQLVKFVKQRMQSLQSWGGGFLDP